MGLVLGFSPTSRVGAMVLLVVSLGLLLGAGSAVAGVVIQRYDFDEPVIKLVDGYDRVHMDGAWSYGDPGEPVLPIAGARLLLPPGETVVSVTVIPGRKVHLGDGYSVAPGQRQYALSYEGPAEHVPPDEAVYQSTAALPASLHGKVEQGLYRGYRIASVPIHPVEYVPSTGSLSYYRTMEVEIRTESDPELARATALRIRHDDATLARLERYIDNPADVASYTSIERTREVSRALDPALAYDYVIVTTSAWESYLGTFVTYQTQRGYKAGTFVKSWITANYSGADEQEQIRNFIIDAYNTWDCDYVLLVGDAMDANGIPHRGLYADAYGTVDGDIPADLYYSALDGTWDGNGNDVYGEIGEEDFYPELAIGRACASSASDVQNFVTKTMIYSNNPIVSECDEALMVGELLWDDPTWGGDSKDEIKDGASTNGYTTAGFPATMNVGTLYDRDATWSYTTLINMMENGLNIVNHLGHCNTIYALKMTTGNIPSFDNDGTTHTLNFVYSQGCYAGAFDNRDDGGSYGTDCYAEEFTCDDDGAVAVVMNGRYGWGAHESTNGSSQYFDREFFDAMFGEGIYPIGDANDDSKVDVIWAINYGANRWCYYELNVFGDPTLHLWTAEPVAMNVIHPSGIIVGQPDIDVTVNGPGSTPLEGARVTIYTDDYDVYDVGVTNASGTVTVHPNPADTDTVRIKVTAHDHLVYDGDITVSPASGPFVVYDSSSVDDDTAGGSNGNADGIVNAGETIELAVTLENVGVTTATGVTATLSTTNGFVTITDAEETYGDIVASGTAVSFEDYDLVIGADAPDGETIQLTLDIQDSAARATWESNLSLQVAAPVLEYADHVADDGSGGNGNGCIEAGETIAISASLANGGSAGATTVDATLSSTDPYVIIYNAEGSVGSIGAGLTQSLTPDFVVAILPSCPAFHEITFDLSIGADWDYDATAQFSIVTSDWDFVDDVESGEGQWTHHNVTGGFGDQWHVETYRYYSSGHSWKFGGSGSAGYGDSSDGVLVMQPMCIGSDGEMTFRDWLYAEEDGTTMAWDCCLVEITTDGGTTWNNLAPVGGYSHTKNDNAANPLPEGTPCWSGYHDWRLETFDLSAYEGETVQIRFRFVSDGYVTEEGWYVDDIQVTSTGSTTSVDDGPSLPRVFALRQNAPNPFNPVTVIQYELPQPARVRIDIYSIDGRLVKTVADEEQAAGHRTVTWDGTNNSGDRVASGVYLYKMQAGDFESRKRMVLLK